MVSTAEDDRGTKRPGVEEIRSRPESSCFLCGTRGLPLYEGVRDRLFGAPGAWSFRRCPDPGCGLIWLDPMPLAEDIGRAYASYFTHREPPRIRGRGSRLRHVYERARDGYLSLRFGYPTGAARWWKAPGALFFFCPRRRTAFDFSVFHLRARPGGRLLEIGCGSGRMLARMRELGWRVEGVDIDPGAVVNARRQDLEVHLGSLPDRRYPDGRFDAAVLSHVIEHVHDPAGLLRECRRILKPGGIASLVTPNGGSRGHVKLGRDWRSLDPPRHLRIFTVPALMRLAAEAGFRIRSLRTTIRDADEIFISGRSVSRTGRHVMGGPHPLAARLRGQGAQCIEWLALAVNPRAGEEIALVAEK